MVLFAGLTNISFGVFMKRKKAGMKGRKVKHSSLVVQALAKTNSNIFNISGIKQKPDINPVKCAHGRVGAPFVILNM